MSANDTQEKSGQYTVAQQIALGLPAPGIPDDYDERDSSGRVIGSAEEQAAFEAWLDEKRRRGRTP